MPSPEFMKSVLETPEAAYARGEGQNGELPDEEQELEEAEVEQQPEDAVVETEQPEQEDAGEDEDAEPETTEPEEPAEDDEGESDQEPEAQEEPFFYTYRSKEEAERGHREKDAAIARQGEELAALRQQAAEMEELKQRLAQVEQGVSQQSFDYEGVQEWAEEWVEHDPEQGIHAAIQLSLESGDQRYAYAYTDKWAETDQYNASVWRNRLETAVFQQQQPQAPELAVPQLTETETRNLAIEQAYAEAKEERPELEDDETLKGIAAVMHATPSLKRAWASGDAYWAKQALLDAHRVYKSQKTTRRLRSSDASKVAEEKLAATSITGDGAPAKRSVTPEDLSPAEEQIVAGLLKQGYKLRD